MQTETVANILLDARRLIDGETTSTTTDYEPDSELIRYLNRAYRQLVNDIIRYGGHDLLVTYEDLVETDDYDHAEVMRPVALEVPVGDKFIELRQFNFRERNRYTDDQFPAWRWMPGGPADGELQFFPPTARPAALRFWYIEALTLYTAANETVATFLGWDAYLSARIAMMCLAKEGRHSEEIQTEFQVAREQVKEACQSINVVEPERVANLHRVPEDAFDEGLPEEQLPRP